jgi:hypothetical protein
VSIGSSRGLELYTLSECINESRKGRDSFTVRVRPAVAFGSYVDTLCDTAERLSHSPGHANRFDENFDNPAVVAGS